MSFVDNAPPSATVRAETDVKVLVLEKRQVEHHLAEEPAFVARFYRALAIFLADRLRSTVSRQKAGSQLDSTEIEEDELDDSILDNVSVAGLRFQQMLKTLASAGSRP